MLRVHDDAIRSAEIGSLHDEYSYQTFSRMTEFSYKKTQVEKIHRPEIKKRVLVLYTGGTIGMIYSENG